MTVRSTWLVATGQSREDTRLTMLGATTPVNTVQVASGVLPGSYGGSWPLSGFWLSGTSAMVGTVNAGRCVIQSSTITQGAYPVTLPDSVALTFADGDAQYDRIDLVVVRVYDALYDTSGLTQADVEIIQGTPAATPVAPTPQGTVLPLYSVRVQANASASSAINWATALTDLRTSTVSSGGIHPVYGNASAAGGYVGQYRDNNGVLERWNGTAWSAYYPPVPTWQSWTPTWTTTTGNATPSLGNATVHCSYVQVGKVVHVNFSIFFGTTTNFGSGATSADNWLFSLPVPAVGPIDAIGFMELGTGASTAVARMRAYDTGHMILEVISQPTQGTATNLAWVDSVTPWNWGSTCGLVGTATYEAA